MTRGFSCSPGEMQPAPIRLPMRLYMRLGKVGADEALNCGVPASNHEAADIAEDLKATLNLWKADGLNIETGRVDYKRMAQSNVIEAYRPLAAALRAFDPAQLTSDDRRKAFWINIYNALLIHGVIAYGARSSLWNIRGAFERIAYVIGGFRYSLDDIEHGILRCNKAHFVIPGVRFSRRDPRRKHALQQLDPRIHFALVCGASSCPPIGIYQADKLDAQLDLAARNFINGGGVIINRAASTVSLSRIFQWYSPDFGGKWMGLGAGRAALRYVLSFLLADNLDYVAERIDDLRIRYQHYDWALNV